MDQVTTFVSDLATISRHIYALPEWIQGCIVASSAMVVTFAVIRVAVAVVRTAHIVIRGVLRTTYNAATYFIPRSQVLDQNFLNLMTNLDSPDAMYDSKEQSFDTGKGVKVYFAPDGRITKIGTGKDFAYDIVPDLNSNEVKLITRKVTDRLAWVKERDRQARRANVPLPSEVALYTGAQGPETKWTIHHDMDVVNSLNLYPTATLPDGTVVGYNAATGKWVPTDRIHKTA